MTLPILVGVLTGTALLLPVRAPVLVFAVAQGGYLLAATVLLVLGGERWLLLALAPSVLGTGAYLVFGQPRLLGTVPWLPLVGCAVLAGCLAAVRAGRLGRGGGHGRLVDGAELRGSFPHALFGLIAAGLLTFPVLVVGLGHGSVLSAMALLTVPLSVSMGAAEWSLHWYRRRMRQLLRDSRTVRQFVPLARLALAAAVAGYLAGAALLVVGTLLVATTARLVTPGWTVVGAGAACLALGCALFLALLLQAFGTGPLTSVACVTALTIEMVVVLGRPGGWGLDVAPAQLLVCSALFAVLVARACVLLGRVTAHV